jgi:hypothetical protein
MPFIAGAGVSAVPVGRAAALAGSTAAKILPSLGNAAIKLSNSARNLFRRKYPPSVPAPNSATRTVSRWMNEAEYVAMAKAGRVLPDSSGGKYILNESAAAGIPGAARPGSIQVQFEIPAGSSSAVTDASKGWEYLYTDRTIRGRLDISRGLTVPSEFPPFTNPTIIGRN